MVVREGFIRNEELIRERINGLFVLSCINIDHI